MRNWMPLTSSAGLPVRVLKGCKLYVGRAAAVLGGTVIRGGLASGRRKCRVPAPIGRGAGAICGRSVDSTRPRVARGTGGQLIPFGVRDDSRNDASVRALCVPPSN